MKPNIGSGDDGKTNLIGKRVWKDDVRIDLQGKIDELNSFIGLSTSKIKFKDMSLVLEEVQKQLFVLGADLANVVKQEKIVKITKDDVKFIENKIQEFEKELEPLTRFILPSGEIASIIHVSRAICREAERKAVRLSKEEEINSNIIPYLNRLSDLLFTFARLYNKRLGIKEKEWIR